ncbi:hypothetical protein AWB92_21410 [Mycobacterium sp. IEC1808]|nr:hypothetical protein AWB92_21410 [Mycobacterium sp. IEC1808]
MYSGLGPGTLLAASEGWASLAAELTDAASGYQAVIAALIDEPWLGPASASMAAAVTPYLSWMTATAARCAQAAVHATAAAAAFETAHAMTVPPPLIAANRAQLIALTATNVFGQNTPAIMATEAAYGEMWAQDAAAMYNYAANSASASAFSAFASPPQTTNSGGIAQPTAARLISSVPRALQTLATTRTRAALPPGVTSLLAQSSTSLGIETLEFDAGLGRAASLGTLSVPPSWADEVSSVIPPPALDANVMPGGWGAAPSPTATAGFAKTAGPRNGRSRVGLRSKIIPRSPVAG